MTSASHDAPAGTRQALRKSLLTRRETFAAGAGFEAAGAALARHLAQVLSALEPQSLGLYWPLGAEFNAAAALAADPMFAKLPIGASSPPRLALPFAQRTPVRMHYRVWDGRAPATVDECGIPTSTGAPTEPDVVLVPCLGFTPDGYRLGYGGGYFDRWLAAHPHVTAVGVAWHVAEIAAGAFVPEPHDIPMTLIVTERGVV